MTLTETIRLYPNKEIETILYRTMDCYIDAVNELLELAKSGISIEKHTSKDVDAPEIPSVGRSQAARQARSIYKKYVRDCKKEEKKKSGKEINLPVMKKPCCLWSNQTFHIEENGHISLILVIDGKAKRVSIATKMPKQQKELLLSKKLGTLRVVTKGRFLTAQITYDVEEEENNGYLIMGVDLGIKCPAVSYTENGKIRFYGNGRQNKYIRRFYKYQRKKLGNKKRDKVIKRIGDKEQRIMKDIDHKLSRAIVNEAVKQEVKIIKLERLANIRSTTRTSRKNNHSLHTWSFYRLAMYIEYKAKLKGITVLYVNPAYTSQTCPLCGEKNHAQDRLYQCECGYEKHRDVVGAINICKSNIIVDADDGLIENDSTKVVGNRLSA